MLKAFKLYMIARVSKLGLSYAELKSLVKRQPDSEEFLGLLIKSHSQKLELNLGEIEEHKLKGGNPAKLIDALSISKRLELDLSKNVAIELNLNGHDIQKLVKMKITPQVFAWPKKDLEEKVIVKGDLNIAWRSYITLRLKHFHLIDKSITLDDLLENMANEIEDIVMTASASELLQNPQLLSNQVMTLKLDSDSAYELISIELIARKLAD